MLDPQSFHLNHLVQWLKFSIGNCCCAQRKFFYAFFSESKSRFVQNEGLGHYQAKSSQESADKPYKKAISLTAFKTSQNKPKIS